MKATPLHHLRLPSRREAFARIASVLPAGWIAACSSSPTGPSPVRLTAEGRSRSFAGFKRAVVLSFVDRASAKEMSSVLDGRSERVAAIRGACVQLADRLAEKLRAESRFQEVARSGPIDDTTLTIAGSLWRYVDADGFTRLRTRNRAGNAQIEIHVELRGGTQNTVLATLVRENAPAGISPAPHASESLEQAADRVIDQIARAIIACVPSVDTARGLP